MPRVAFSEENRVSTTNYEYPKLKLKSGERARIVLLEDPVVEYVHTLRAPKIVDGVPQMKTEEKNGRNVTENVMDFISRPLCLGDFATLEDKASDPKKCPICQLAKDHPDMAQAPQARYAMHVIRYRTKGGGFDLVKPFSVETLVWSFTGRLFNKILDFKSEWDDLRKHDLLLGPCENENFQKFDIAVGAKAAWLETPEQKALTIETFKNQQIPDLSIACGSKKERKWLDEDVDKVVAAWRIVNGKSADPQDTASLDDDLNDLMGGGSPAKAQEEWAPSSDNASDSLDDLLGDETGTEETKKEEPKKETVPSSKSDSETDSFDDLLADL